LSLVTSIVPPLSYRSPKTEVRESKIHGCGLFAKADIARGEIVAIKGGYIVDRETLRREIMPRLGPVEIQIDDDLFIAPVNATNATCRCCIQIIPAIRTSLFGAKSRL